MEKKLYTVKEVMEYLGVCRNTIYRAIYSGKVSPAKVGSSYRFTEEDIQKFIQPAQPQEKKE